MANLYEILRISQNASDEEIDNAYKTLGKQYQSDINSNTNVAEAEKNMQLIASAYKILRTPAKRKEYDQFLENEEREKKENEEMSKSINSSLSDILSEEPSKPEEPKQEELSEDQKKGIEQARLIKEALARQKQQAAEAQAQAQKGPYLSPEEAKKKLEEIERYQLAQKEQLEKAKLAQLEYEKAKLETEKEKERLKQEMMKKYNDTYNAYMKQMGYKEKKPWTWKRIKNILIVVIVTIVCCIIAWQIPAVKNPIVELYNTNGIFKFFADIFISTFKMIWNMITGIFKK